MNKRSENITVFFLAVVVVLLILVTQGCATSMQRFEPTMKPVYNAAELYRQAGLPEIRQSMDCRVYYQAQMDWCDIMGHCTQRRFTYYERRKRQVGFFCIMDFSGLRGRRP